MKIKNKNLFIVLVVLLAVGMLCGIITTMKAKNKEENDYINPYIRKIRAISMFKQIRQPCEEICDEMQKIKLLDNDIIRVDFAIQSEILRDNIDSNFENVIHVYDGKVECRNNAELNSLLQENEKLCNALIGLEKIGIIVYIEYFSKGFVFLNESISEQYDIRFMYAIDKKDIDDDFILEDKWMCEEIWHHSCLND